MFVYKVSLCFVLILCFVRKIDGVDQHGSGSFSGIAFEMLLTKLDLMQEHLFETDQKLGVLSQAIDQLTVVQTETKAAMKEQREYIDQKLSGLEKTMNNKLTSLQTQLNVVMKEHRQSIDLKLSHQENSSKGLMRAIDQLGLKMAELQAQSCSIVKKDQESIDQKLVGVTGSIKKLDQSLNNLKQQSNETLKEFKEPTNQKLNQLTQTVDDEFNALQAQSHKTEQSTFAEYEQMRGGMTNLELSLEMFQMNSQKFYANLTIPSCKSNPSTQSGKYCIMRNPYDTPFEAYCDQSVFGGGWLVFQYRFNGSVNFYRNWEAYRNGFGSLEGEFWLGLEQLHQLTSARKYELLVELKDYSGVYTYALYDEFQIGSAKEKYALQKLGSYSGTAGDSLRDNMGRKFSTRDQDNDICWPGCNCADAVKGAWWYSSCGFSNLNGLYKNDGGKNKMYWYSNADFGYMIYTRMSIREI